MRLVDADGHGPDGGSVLWESTEWQCPSEEVMGSILGAAMSLT